MLKIRKWGDPTIGPKKLCEYFVMYVDDFEILTSISVLGSYILLKLTKAGK